MDNRIDYYKELALDSLTDAARSEGAIQVTTEQTLQAAQVHALLYVGDCVREMTSVLDIIRGHMR